MSPKRQVSPRHSPWMVRLVPHPGSEPQQAGKGQVSLLCVPPTHSLHCMSEHGPCVGYLSPEPGGKACEPVPGERRIWSSMVLPIRAGNPWTVPHSTYQPPLGHMFPLMPAILPRAHLGNISEFHPQHSWSPQLYPPGPRGLSTLTSSHWLVPCLSASLLGVLVIATALVAYFRPWRKPGQ